MVDLSRAKVGPEPKESALRKVPASVFYGRLARLRRANPAHLSEQEAFDRLSRAFHGYIMKSVIIGTNGVFRARIGTQQHLFENVEQLWYPPANAISTRGRFNGIGESRFYCSTEAFAALFEVRPKVGDRITLLIAGARDRRKQVELAHIGIHRAMVGAEVVGTMGGGLRGNEDFLAQLEAWGVRRRWLKLDDYLTELATSLYAPEEEQDRYKLTLSASRFLLRPSGYEGILYPSVASGLGAFNLCLYPKAADEIYFPSEVWVADVVSVGLSKDGIDDIEVQFVCKSNAISSSGRIEWSGPLGDVKAQDVLAGIGRSPHRESVYTPTTSH